MNTPPHVHVCTHNTQTHIERDRQTHVHTRTVYMYVCTCVCMYVSVRVRMCIQGWAIGGIVAKSWRQVNRESAKGVFSFRHGPGAIYII